MRDLRDEIKPRARKTKQVNPIEQILDENNTDNVILYDPDQKPIEFEQIAVIPLEDENSGEQTLYTIMIPITPMQGVGEGEGVLFKIDQQKRDLDIVRDEAVIDHVLEVYERLIEEGEDNNKGKK